MFEFDQELNDVHKSIFEKFENEFEAKLSVLKHITDSCRLRVTYSKGMEVDDVSPCQIINQTIQLNPSFDEYSEKEQKALIAHEIGHLNDFNNEYACDAVAKDLDLGVHMKSSLMKMINAIQSKSADPFFKSIFSENMNKQVMDLEERMRLL